MSDINFTGWKYTDTNKTAIQSPDKTKSITVADAEVAAWVEEGNTPDAADAAPDPTWQEKRQANIAGGGYGAVTEQLEIIGEQGMTAFQNHIAAVKAAIPKS